MVLLTFFFERKGVFEISRENLTGTNLEEFEMELIDYGLEELSEGEDVVTLYTSFDAFGNMQKELENRGIEPSSQEVHRIPNNTEELELEKAKKVWTMIEKFEEDDDVNAVYHNLELTEELAEAIS